MNENVSVELVKVKYSSQRSTVLGRDLHQMLGSKTAYKAWFPRMCEYGFEEGRDFILLPAQKRAINNPKKPWTMITR
ncbi:MAG: antA/AntB antirepressor family protein [Alphaproteobacteria bacterium]|nr:antA/AntB antirepressor family protein [Alphaproteobacteria bacterium]